MRRAIAIRERGHWPPEETVDSVTLVFLDRRRRRIRLVADSGEAFLLDVPRAGRMGEGDGLELAGGGFILVHAAPEPVYEIAAADAASLLRIAWHLGSRHLPLQVADDKLRIRADRVMAEVVAGLGGRITAIDAPFEPEIGAYAAPPPGSSATR